MGYYHRVINDYYDEKNYWWVIMMGYYTNYLSLLMGYDRKTMALMGYGMMYIDVPMNMIYPYKFLSIIDELLGIAQQ